MESVARSREAGEVGGTGTLGVGRVVVVGEEGLNGAHSVRREGRARGSVGGGASDGRSDERERNGGGGELLVRAGTSVCDG